MYKYMKKKIDDFIPYINNARTHSEEQINQIASSIKEFKFTNPVLIDEDGGIIAGHGRIEAAKKLNIKEIPCIVLEGLTEAQKKAYIIADNQLPLNAWWDIEKLKLEIESLEEMDFNIDLLGFDKIELGKMFDDDALNDLKEEEYTETFSIIVECKNEEEQEKIFNRLDAEGYKCRVQSL